MPMHVYIYLFAFCRKLKRLNLGGNLLTAIPQKSLAILDMLKKLELQENRISDIREGDFEGMLNNNEETIELPLILLYSVQVCAI